MSSWVHGRRGGRRDLGADPPGLQWTRRASSKRDCATGSMDALLHRPFLCTGHLKIAQGGVLRPPPCVHCPLPIAGQRGCRFSARAFFHAQDTYGKHKRMTFVLSIHDIAFARLLASFCWMRIGRCRLVAGVQRVAPLAGILRRQDITGYIFVRKDGDCATGFRVAVVRQFAYLAWSWKWV